MNLAQRRRSQKILDWANRHQGPSSDVSHELLSIPFAEWCESLKIKTQKGLQPFTLYDWQLETAKLISGTSQVKGRQIVVLSSRQTGKTSLFLTLAGHQAQERSHYTGVLIHKTGMDSSYLVRRLKRFLGDVDLDPDNLSLVGFSNGAFLHFRSSNPKRGEEGAEQCGRGLESVDLLIVEESGHTANLFDVLGVVGPALQHGNPKLTILIGTAGSKQSYYYQLLAQAAGSAEQLEAILSGIRDGTKAPFQILNKEGLGPIAVISNWRCIPEFAAEPDFLGRIREELNLSEAQIASEYEMQFSTSVDHAVFDFALVKAAQINKTVVPSLDGSEIFYVGCDPAGDGKDYVVAIALRLDYVTDEEGIESKIFSVVKLYRKRTGAAMVHLNAIALLLEKLEAITATVEKNSMGSVWIENLSSQKLLTSIEEFTTTAQSKAALIGRIQIALERGALKIPKGPIIDELLSFRRTDGGKLEAGAGSHDDCVMALGLALHAAGYN